MIEVKQNIAIHNRFDLELIDSRTGKVKQTAQAENTAVDAWWNPYNSGLYTCFNYQVQLGTGTGEPSSSDTGLFKYAFALGGGSVISSEFKLPTSKQVKSFTAPATTAYVGNLTEIGLATPHAFATHAMLSDAEGNPIVIEKTEFDILVVTTTVYVTIESTNEKFIPQPYNNAFWYGFKYSTSSYSCKLLLTNYATKKTVSAFGASEVINMSYSKKKFACSTTRLNTDKNNIGWINALYFSTSANSEVYGIGWVKLPNADIFPPFEFKDLNIGTGDGETKEFKCPWSNFIKDSEVIYKNGVALTRGVDYTVDNCNAFHQAMSTFNFAEVDGPTHYYGNNYSFDYQFTGRMLTTEKRNVNGGVLEYYLRDKIVAHLADPDPIKGRRINSLFLRGISLTDGTYHGRSGGNRNSTFRIVLEKSDDGETWEQFFETPDLHPYGQGSAARYSIDADYSFELIEPEYIRVSFKAGDTGVFDGNTPIQSNGYDLQTYSSIWLDYVGEGIVFTEAPAEGDVLTMDCMLDRPYKNSNFVMDIAASIEFE